MSALKSLTFTTLPTQGANPILDRRAKIIPRLVEQKLLLADPNYARTVRAWVKKDGEKSVVEKRQRVLPWSLAPNRSYVFFVRAGWKSVEFEKGKPAIAVPSLDKLPSIIDTLIAAFATANLINTGGADQASVAERWRGDGQGGAVVALLP